MLRSSQAKVEARAVHDGVAVANAEAAGVAAVAGTAGMEVTTAASVVLAVIQMNPKGTVEATTAPVAVEVAAAEIVAIPRPLLALKAEGPHERGVHHEGDRFHAQVC